ncbi:hypothetical protein [Microbacterium lacticum]
MSENHDAVAGHDLPVEVRAGTVAEGLPSLVFEVEQLVEHDAWLLRSVKLQPTEGSWQSHRASSPSEVSRSPQLIVRHCQRRTVDRGEGFVKAVH